MAKPSITRKSVALPDSMWLEIDALRRSWPTPLLPAEAEIVRALLREALDARKNKIRGKRK
jgi:hypothetical protein